MRWGLVPPWSRDPADKGRQINARSETMFEKRTFADAARHRRCLIPASGLLRVQKPVDGGRAAGKQPFWIGRIDGEPMAFAGICNDATPGCAILTMEARPSLAAIHHRMPVMLDAAAWNAWLDPDRTDPEAISASLRPIAEDRLTAWPVSRAVNDPRNDDESLRTPIDPPKPAQPSLF